MPKTVLLVDDDPLFIEVVRDLLEVHQYRVLMAQNGFDALHLLTEHNVDIIVSDIEMPVMNGIAFHARFSESDSYRNIPFVFLTSTDDGDKINYVRKHAHVALIRKSSMVDELIKTVGYLTTIP
ncbi:MAG: response regulator [Bacteroidetes bacterium]|nr:response regulator [Bacteroidota bacterium]MCW5894457.1 response regulator [Bacteroidota bacterium]